ncbi:MAG: protein phosphatase 2C domain-containing protein, partial [Clostridiales bacterium]|nr:protein phosphatase 2C domain-containing protein [Clostridiales bacterium]
MKSYALTDKGNVRKENQDCVLVTEIRSKGCLAAVVCDGMGGIHGGRLASELAVSAFMADFRKSLLRSTERRPDLAVLLQNACAEANRVVYQ